MELTRHRETLTHQKAKQIMEAISKYVMGQTDVIEKAVVVMLSNGHLLIEGVPGLAKTLLAKAMAYTVASKFKRIQFTPDLMPSDLLGTKVFDIKNGEFYFRKGPLFTNFLLADEINRTPPKTQAALLECMEERRITIDGETYKMADPFFVVATQNPVEYEGTYPLPEAQLDRFMMKIILHYPTQEYENMMLQGMTHQMSGHELDRREIQTVCDTEELVQIRKEITSVEVSKDVIEYITNIVRATRNSAAIMLGASPRASVALMQVAKTFAAIQCRNYVIPEDIKELALPVLRHRMLLKPEAALDGVTSDHVIQGILNKMEVPR